MWAIHITEVICYLPFDSIGLDMQYQLSRSKIKSAILFELELPERDLQFAKLQQN